MFRCPGVAVRVIYTPSVRGPTLARSCSSSPTPCMTSDGATIIDGKAISAEIRAEIKQHATELKEQQFTPGLAVVLVGAERFRRLSPEEEGRSGGGLPLGGQDVRRERHRGERSVCARLERTQVHGSPAAAAPTSTRQRCSAIREGRRRILGGQHRQHVPRARSRLALPRRRGASSC